MAVLRRMRHEHADPRVHERLRGRLEGVRARRQHMELSRRQRALFATMALFQLTLLVAAQADMFRRSSSEVRGPKWLWRIVAFVNFIGPLSYFAFGRATSQEADAT